MILSLSLRHHPVQRLASDGERFCALRGLSPPQLHESVILKPLVPAAARSMTGARSVTGPESGARRRPTPGQRVGRRRHNRATAQTTAMEGYSAGTSSDGASEVHTGPSGTVAAAGSGFSGLLVSSRYSAHAACASDSGSKSAKLGPT
jgi:hypothetical protein